MSKGLATLVRMHRWQVDEKRKTVTELERLRDGLADQGRKLDAEVEAEKAAASGSADASRTLAPYLDQMRERQQKLAQSIGEVERQLEAANAELAETFREYKKHETVLNNRIKRAKEEADKRQQAALDEMALQGHRRQQGNN